MYHPVNSLHTAYRTTTSLATAADPQSVCCGPVVSSYTTMVCRGLSDPAGIRVLLGWSASSAEPLFEAVEGVPCRAALLDGPAALVACLLSYGATSDSGLAVIQAGALSIIEAAGHNAVHCTNAL